MTTPAAREVTYTLTVANAQKNAQALREFVQGIKAAEDQANGVRQSSAERAERIQRKQAEQAARAAERAAKDQERAAAKAEREAAKQARAAERVVKEQERAAAQLARENERALKVAERSLAAQERAAAKLAKEQERAAAQAERAQTKAINSHVRESESAARAVVSHNSAMRESVAQLQEGVVKLGRGFALLGVVGTEDAQALLDSLVKIQAAFDIVNGGIKTYHALTKAVESYRAAVTAAAAAEAAAAAARAAGGGTVARSGAGAAAAGVGAGLTGGVAVAAILSAGAAAKILAENLTGSADRLDSWTSRIAAAEVSWGAWAASSLPAGYRLGFGGLLDSQGAAQRAASNLDDAQAQSARRDAVAAILGGVGLALEGSARDRFSATAGFRGSAAELAAINAEAARARAATPTGGLDPERLAEVQIDAADYQTRLARERFRLEREIIDGRRDASKREIDAAQESLRLTKTKLDAERDRLSTAAERFGQLTTAEQQRVLAAGRRAATVSPEQLSREERQLLRGVGLDSTTDVARAGDIAAAEAAGFSTVFGEADRARVASLERERAAIELRIADQRALQVTIDRDENAIAEAAVAAIQLELAERDRALANLIKAQTQAALSQVNQASNQQLRARAGVFGR